MELGIQFESPNFMQNLFYTTALLYKDGLREIAAIIVSHGYNVATERLGAFHPVAQIFGMLQELDAVRRELESRLLQCQLDILENELGPWHFDTAATRSDLLLLIDASEAIDRARASLAAYEMTGSKCDRTLFENSNTLAWVLTCDGQYAAAEKTCGDILDAIDAATDFNQASAFKARAFWLLSHIAREADNNMIKAEGFAQQAVLEAAVAWGWQHSETIRCMVERANLLRKLGRFEEAGEVETQIEDILGPPEIEELLN